MLKLLPLRWSSARPKVQGFETSYDAALEKVETQSKLAEILVADVKEATTLAETATRMANTSATACDAKITAAKDSIDSADFARTKCLRATAAATAASQSATEATTRANQAAKTATDAGKAVTTSWTEDHASIADKIKIMDRWLVTTKTKIETWGQDEKARIESERRRAKGEDGRVVGETSRGAQRSETTAR